MVSGFAGSNASVTTARLAIWSVFVVQLVPPFVVFQTPPATPPAYITSGVVGWMIRARVRPPWLFGPRLLQVPSALPGVAANGSNGPAAIAPVTRPVSL